ncbi:MAG: PAS domain-containing protein, partial [Aquabacterium sp.]|nr:PAS domain-containing protein [Aquabacterium sp.]
MVDLPASAVLNSGPVHQAVLNALDQLGLAVLVKDLSSGRYVYASDAASRLLHAGDDALEGVQDADIFDATQAVALRAADVQAASMPNGLRSEHRMELRGARRDFRVWRQQVALEGQSEPHMLSLWQDITETHQREAQIAQALAQLEQQQKANDALRRDMEDNQVRDTSSGLYHRVHFDE